MGDAMFMSVEEAARRIGIGRSLAYELCRAHLHGREDGLRCIRLGRRVLVPRWAVEELGQPTASEAASADDELANDE